MGQPVCSGEGAFVAVAHSFCERMCMQFCICVCMSVRLQHFGIACKECFLAFFKLLTCRFIYCTADMKPK